MRTEPIAGSVVYIHRYGKTAGTRRENQPAEARPVIRRLLPRPLGRLITPHLFQSIVSRPSTARAPEAAPRTPRHRENGDIESPLIVARDRNNSDPFIEATVRPLTP
jgi:hypothetical protein